MKIQSRRRKQNLDSSARMIERVTMFGRNAQSAVPDLNRNTSSGMKSAISRQQLFIAIYALIRARNLPGKNYKVIGIKSTETKQQGLHLKQKEELDIDNKMAYQIAIFV